MIFWRDFDGFIILQTLTSTFELEQALMNLDVSCNEADGIKILRNFHFREKFFLATKENVLCVKRSSTGRRRY